MVLHAFVTGFIVTKTNEEPGRGLKRKYFPKIKSYTSATNRMLHKVIFLNCILTFLNTEFSFSEIGYRA